MKKFLLIILLSLVSVRAHSQKVCNTDFEYPIKPGDAKWENISSVAERIAALQIPEAILAIIPTESLLDICLDFPYLLDVLFYEDYQKGLEALRAEFNGFDELLNRKDIGKFALAKNKNFPLELEKLKDKNDIKKGIFSFQCFVLDLILAQENVVKTLSNSEEDELLEVSIQNMELRNQQKDVFGSISTTPLYLSYAKSTLPNSNVKYADSKRIITSDDYKPITTVKTPKGSIVPHTGVLKVSDVYTSDSEIASLSEYLRVNYNGAILVDAPSYKYNCHAYAWHVSEGGDKVWIGIYDSPLDKPIAEDVYWEDGSYYEVPESEATKVSYHETGDHSAIRLSSEWYQSKWGSWPLVKHHPNDVPMGYNPQMAKKYYKKLPVMSIQGQTYICSFADYYVTNLPAGATVNWKYTPLSSFKPSIQQNTPSNNYCTIDNTYGQCFEGLLNAEINYRGKIIDTVSRIIRGDSDNFVGFYWQPSSDGSWVPDMSISLDEPNIAIPPNDVIIESENFRGKRISCTAMGSTSFLTNSASNRVSFEMPSLPDGELLTVRVDGSDCSSPITFTFASQNYFRSKNMNVLKITHLEANHYLISFDRSDSIEMASDEATRNQLISTEAPNWSLEVHNAMSTQKIKECKVVGSSYMLDMSALNSGIYIITAIMGDKKYTEKIIKQ